ncbi:hypothetical protein [Flavihumibacter petaseus]|nr:hypothetical protein [Flavihumibacter petaseus]
MENYNSLIEALEELRKKGYTTDFSASELSLHTDEFTIDAVYRFEVDSDPGNDAVLYAISDASGRRGTVVDGYGVYNDHLSFEIARHLHSAITL